MSQVDDLGLPPGLRDEYLQGARDQLGGVAELAERLIDAGDDAAAIEELRREAHKLRGSAGSFGFAQASVVAAELEDAAKQWLAQPADDDPRFRRYPALPVLTCPGYEPSPEPSWGRP